MPEPRDLWAKLDIIGKILTPVVIFALGTMYNWHQQKVNEAQKTAERVANLVKSLHSDKSQEKLAALALLRLERQKHPEDVPEELLVSTIPTLVDLAVNDRNPEVSQQAQEAIAEVTQKVESSVAASLEKTAKTLSARVYFHILREEQRAAAREIKLKLEAKGWNVPGIEKVKAVPQRTELRYFRANEEQEAHAITDSLKSCGVQEAEARYIAGNEDNKNIRPRHFELWFHAEALRENAQ